MCTKSTQESGHLYVWEEIIAWKVRFHIYFSFWWLNGLITTSTMPNAPVENSSLESVFLCFTKSVVFHFKNLFHDFISKPILIEPHAVHIGSHISNTWFWTPIDTTHFSSSNLHWKVSWPSRTAPVYAGVPILDDADRSAPECWLQS